MDGSFIDLADTTLTQPSPMRFYRLEASAGLVLPHTCVYQPEDVRPDNQAPSSASDMAGSGLEWRVSNYLAHRKIS